MHLPFSHLETVLFEMPSRSTSNPCVRFSSLRFLAMQLPMAAWFIEAPPVLRTAQACDKSGGRGIPVGRIQGNMGPSDSFRHGCMDLRHARTTHPAKTYVEHAATLPARSCFKQRNPPARYRPASSTRPPRPVKARAERATIPGGARLAHTPQFDTRSK